MFLALSTIPPVVSSGKEPMTRKALDLLRKSYKDPAEFMCSLFGDPFLKQKLKIIIYDLQEKLPNICFAKSILEEKT